MYGIIIHCFTVYTWLNANESISCSSQSDFRKDPLSRRQFSRGWSSLMLRHSLPLMSRWVFNDTVVIVSPLLQFLQQENDITSKKSVLSDHRKQQNLWNSIVQYPFNINDGGIWRQFILHFKWLKIKLWYWSCCIEI